MKRTTNVRTDFKISFVCMCMCLCHDFRSFHSSFTPLMRRANAGKKITSACLFARFFDPPPKTEFGAI